MAFIFGFHVPHLPQSLKSDFLSVYQSIAIRWFSRVALAMVFFTVCVFAVVSLSHATEVLEESVHAGLGCQVCHKEGEEGGPVDCTKCHEIQARAYSHGIHAGAAGADEPAASCADCHGNHDILPADDKNSALSRFNLASTCGQCHPSQQGEYLLGIHGEIETADPGSGPNCMDCHGSHDILSVTGKAFKFGAASRCGSCHPDAFDSYKESLHGQVVTLRESAGAGCADCHSAHRILPSADPHSTISSENRLKTCQICHEKADVYFASFWPHASVHDRENYPILYYLYVLMKSLFLFVMITSTIHTLSWLRSLPKLVSERTEKPMGRHHVYYLRFSLYHRLTHFFLFVSVVGLAFSGLPLRYAGEPWALHIVGIFGSYENLDIFHKLMAALLFMVVAYHAFFLVGLLKKMGIRGFKRFLFSPESLFPRIQDFKDMWIHLQCLLHGGVSPRWDRWTYWEKFDYWAVFWGMIVIGLSGTMLAFPDIVTRFFPGWFLNIALVFHSEEALLAIFFLFVFHFFHAHLRPMKFPIDEAILTGTVSEKEYFHERSAEVARRSPEELKKMTAPPPKFAFRVLVYIVSFIVVDIGLILLACVLYTAWKAGTLLP